MEIGDCYQSLGRMQRAVDFFSRALLACPGDALIMAKKGYAMHYLDPEQRTEGKALCEKALAAKPDSEVVLTIVGELLVVDDPSRAKHLIDTALSICPQSARAWFCKGMLYESKDRFHEAAECFDKALSLEPQNSFALLRKGALLTDVLGLHDEALQCFNAAASIEPRNTECWWNLSQAYMRKGDSQTAVVQLDKLLEIAPDDMAALQNKAALLQRLGRHAEAAAPIPCQPFT